MVHLGHSAVQHRLDVTVRYGPSTPLHLRSAFRAAANLNVANGLTALAARVTTQTFPSQPKTTIFGQPCRQRTSASSRKAADNMRTTSGNFRSHL